MNKTITAPFISIITLFLLANSSISYGAPLPINLSQKPLFITTGEPANVLVILDNSNSMDEAANGSAVGGADPNSKSVIARRAVIDLVSNYTGKINMGLMAYQQENVVRRQLHNSPYDASFDPNNYNPAFTGDRSSLTKRFRVPNFSNPGEFVHYNIALPFYSNANLAHAYCYTSTSTFDTGVEALPNGPWDVYRCFRNKTSTSDVIPAWGNGASETASGFTSYWFGGAFSPTDSDIAQNLLDFGTFLTWDWVSPTWFSNSSPGRGYLHVPISHLDGSQVDVINVKLGKTSGQNQVDWGKSQFVDNKPFDPGFPLQNAGLTPLEGTLLTAKDYFSNPASLPADQGGGGIPSLPESCGKDFIALLTDGLPSTDASGTTTTDTNTALAAVANAAGELKTDGIDTYTIGFALPVGTASDALDTIAASGGTGTAYLADDPVSLQATFDTVFKDILVRTGASSSAASNSTTLSSSSVIYQARFNPNDNWSGDLLAFALSYTASGAALNVSINSTATWSAAAQLETKNATDRTILTYARDNSTAISGIPFRWSEIDALSNTTVKDALNTNPITSTTDGNGSDRVDYLRGDTGGSSASIFRSERVGKLGAVIHSSPFYVGYPNAGYSDVDYSGDASNAISGFKNTYLTRTPIIYTGANDGMLHGFDAGTGNEVLAFIPGEVLPEINQLTADGYGTSLPHQYFVDGSPMVADVKLTSGWKTVLAGGLNRGGQGVYALDITNPSSFTEANASNIVLWEFTDENDADLGFTYNQPTLNTNTKQTAQIAKMANDKWALIIGNGYNNTDPDGYASTTGHAALFIIFIESGLDGDWTTGDYIKIDTGEGSLSLPNGLATPVPLDHDNDGKVDFIYAGDLEGNLWKFDVSDSDPTAWGNKIGNNDDEPLFTASYTDSNSIVHVQPITTAPIISAHPTQGYVIGFGTGKYLEHSDITDTNTQSFYGIWDKNEQSPQTVAHSNLVQQSVTYTSTGGYPKYRVSSNNEVNYDSKYGWYMNLPEAGEKVSVNPLFRPGRFVFATRTPREALTPCDPGGGSSWLMELDHLTGGPLPISPLDLNGDGIVNDEDYVTLTVDLDGDGNLDKVPVSGLQNGDGMMSTPTVIDTTGIALDQIAGYGQQEIKLINKTTAVTLVENESGLGGQPPPPPPPPPGGATGRRLSWEEIR